MRLPIVPDPWLDPQRLENLSHEATRYFKKIIVPLSRSLDELTGLSWNNRAWEILIGPWLRSFTFVVAEKRCFLEEQGLHKRLISVSESQFGTQGVESMSEWIDLTLTSELHTYLFQEVAHAYGIVPRREEFRHAEKKVASKTTIPKLEILLSDVASRLGVLSSGSAFMFHKTYLSRKNELFLSLKLGRLPLPTERFHTISLIQKDVALRNRLLSSLRHSKALSGKLGDQIYRLIAQCLPTNHLEGIEHLANAVDKANWPKAPKVIFDSNGYWADDVFKYYVASQTDKGAKLVIGQHGGMLGSSKWSSQLDHQLAVSDKFLSWGWTMGLGEKVAPLGMLKPIERVRPRQGAPAVMPLLSLPQYAYDNSAFPIGAGGWESYFQDQLQFLNALKELEADEVHLRSYPKDRGGFALERLGEAGWVNSVIPSRPLKKDLRNYRLVIVTYNSTILLETLAANHPTVAFWDFERWPLNDTATPYFEMLKEAGILFSSPLSAASHVEKIWSNINAWWLSPHVQNLRLEFVSQFAKQLSVGALAATLRMEKSSYSTEPTSAPPP